MKDQTSQPAGPVQEQPRFRFAVADVAIVGASIAAAVALGAVNSFEWFYRVTRRYEAWNLDEIANGFFIGFIALTAMLAIRHRRLQREVKLRIKAEAEAEALARHDPLTGIANRRLFNEQVGRLMTEAHEGLVTGALLVIDLNRFKSLNDIYGHAAGDQLLLAVTERIRKLVRETDIFARLGGDEFGIALATATREGVVRLANRIVAELDEPFDIGNVRAEIGASVGIALFPANADDAETLIQRADLAMYRAKSDGVSGHAFFDPKLDEALRNRVALEVDLRQAIGTDAIVPYYQPLVDLNTGETSGFEMLARWRHPTRGVILPEVFIPLAEDTRLIGVLSLGLIRRAVSDALAWDPRLFLSVNISPEQFSDRDLATKILSILGAADFPPKRLEIELTESALVADVAAAKEIILQFKRAGVTIAIDDFGSGYSSLYYLRELPFDVVKIDQSFVGTRGSNPESAKIVGAVIGLTRALGLQTVAEGIETSADATWLHEEGCDTGQGYLYSRPMPADEVAGYLRAQVRAKVRA
jgi:diguanylate cyclase (GGDEF)-like protein